MTHYRYGFLFLVFVILIITCSETTILLCYFHLCAEVSCHKPEYRVQKRKMFFSSGLSLVVEKFSDQWLHCFLLCRLLYPLLLHKAGH